MSIHSHDKRLARIEFLIIGSKLIPPTLLQREQELTSMKWFSYRFMSPLEATLEFGRCYQKAIRKYVGQNVDRNLGEKVSGTNLTIPPKPTSSFTQLWQARQEADIRGIPYEHYLEFGFHFAGRRARKATPRPVQLGPNHKTRVAWETTFELYVEDNLEHILRSAVMPGQFRFEAYCELPPQIAFRKLVLKLIEGSSAPRHMEIASWSGDKRVLPIRSIVDPSHRHLIKNAISYLRFERDAGIAPKHSEPMMELSRNDFWPSCLGVPLAKDNTKPECSHCPFARECEIVSHHVLTKADMLPVTLDVEEAEKNRDRMMVRERVQKHRDKKKVPPNKMQAAINYLKLNSRNNRKRASPPEEA